MFPFLYTCGIHKYFIIPGHGETSQNSKDNVVLSKQVIIVSFWLEKCFKAVDKSS